MIDEGLRSEWSKQGVFTTTLEDLSQQYGMSRERVRQIEVRAFEKLQKAIKAAAIERRLVTH